MALRIVLNETCLFNVRQYKGCPVLKPSRVPPTIRTDGRKKYDGRDLSQNAKPNKDKDLKKHWGKKWTWFAHDAQKWTTESLGSAARVLKCCMLVTSTIFFGFASVGDIFNHLPGKPSSLKNSKDREERSVIETTQGKFCWQHRFASKNLGITN